MRSSFCTVFVWIFLVSFINGCSLPPSGQESSTHLITSAAFVAFGSPRGQWPTSRLHDANDPGLDGCRGQVGDHVGLRRSSVRPSIRGVKRDLGQQLRDTTELLGLGRARHSGQPPCHGPQLDEMSQKRTAGAYHVRDHREGSQNQNILLRHPCPPGQAKPCSCSYSNSHTVRTAARSSSPLKS